jgi:hypothetical protein
VAKGTSAGGFAGERSPRSQAEIVALNALKSLRLVNDCDPSVRNPRKLGVSPSLEIVALKSLRQFFCDDYFDLHTGL